MTRHQLFKGFLQLPTEVHLELAKYLKVSEIAEIARLHPRLSNVYWPIYWSDVYIPATGAESFPASAEFTLEQLLKTEESVAHYPRVSCVRRQFAETRKNAGYVKTIRISALSISKMNSQSPGIFAVLLLAITPERFPRLARIVVSKQLTDFDGFLAAFFDETVQARVMTPFILDKLRLDATFVVTASGERLLRSQELDASARSVMFGLLNSIDVTMTGIEPRELEFDIFANIKSLWLRRHYTPDNEILTKRLCSLERLEDLHLVIPCSIEPQTNGIKFDRLITSLHKVPKVKRFELCFSTDFGTSNAHDSIFWLTDSADVFVLSQITDISVDSIFPNFNLSELFQSISFPNLEKIEILRGTVQFNASHGMASNNSSILDCVSNISLWTEAKYFAGSFYLLNALNPRAVSKITNKFVTAVDFTILESHFSKTLMARWASFRHERMPIENKDEFDELFIIISDALDSEVNGLLYLGSQLEAFGFSGSEITHAKDIFMVESFCRQLARFHKLNECVVEFDSVPCPLHLLADTLKDLEYISMLKVAYSRDMVDSLEKACQIIGIPARYVESGDGSGLMGQKRAFFYDIGMFRNEAKTVRDLRRIHLSE